MTNEEKNEEIKGIAMVVLAGISASNLGSIRILNSSDIDKEILIEDVFHIAKLFINKSIEFETEEE